MVSQVHRIPSISRDAKATKIATLRTLMKTIKTHLAGKHLKIYAFYAEEFGLKLETLLQSDAYSQATILTDDAFWALEGMEQAMIQEDRQPFELTFSDETFALLRRIADLLHRPLGELLEGLLSAGAMCLACHIKDALNGAGLSNDPHVGQWFETAVRFDLDARRNRAPVGKDGMDCWDTFAIEKPKKRAKRTLAT